MRAVVGLGVVAVLANTRTASAGDTAFGWVYDTSTLRARKVELQMWISEENDQGATHLRETELWLMPVLGATSHLELALPLVLDAESEMDVAQHTTFARYGVEGRWRFAPPVARGASAPEGVVPLVRAAFYREVDERGARLEIDGVLSWTRGRMHAAVDLGYVARYLADDGEREIYPRAGASLLVAPGLRAGVEAFAELGIEHPSKPELAWLIVGPDIAVTRGRVWLTATLGVGISGIRTAPRVLLGIML